METTEYSLHELIVKAEHYAASAERCVYDIQLKLRQWGCTSSDEQTVIEHLMEHGFINHSRYANAFVHDKLHFQNWGRVKIAYALRAKKIEDSIIDEALGNIDEQDYTAILRKVALLKKNANREQQIRFLLQRGFSYGDISELSCLERRM
ncbi:MAG: RecX family transcriptional regulator [Paludibacteraceae bacterium]|nr:RecX family transcriptional regulator [Paludibacteraceae bacterium]